MAKPIDLRAENAGREIGGESIDFVDEFLTKLSVRQLVCEVRFSFPRVAESIAAVAKIAMEA